jgi:Cysteine-rich CPXCG
MTATGTYSCPHCGEEVDSWPDPGGGEEQSYVEDCPVCCRPNLIHASYSSEDDGFFLSAQPEND